MKLLTGFLVGVSLLCSISQAQAIAINDQMYVAYQMVVNGNTYVNDSSMVTVTDGVELLGFGGIVDINVSDASPDISFDFSDVLFFQQFSSVEFNGFAFVDTLNMIDDFVSLTIASSNLEGFDASRINVSKDAILLNFSGLSFNSDTYISFDLGPVSVSEPQAILLFGFGLLGLIAGVRRNSQFR